MKVLFYDTETTGLPDWNKPSEDPCQPRVVQLCAELFDDEAGRVLNSLNCIIRPIDWEVPEEAAAVHGITTELARQHGLWMSCVLPLFNALWRQADIRCAHNESFDMRMLRIEFMRDPGFGAEHADEWKAGKSFCTQAKSTNVLNLPPTPRMVAAGRNHAKSPNLGEAYEFFTGSKLVNAHDAAVDVAACKAVYLALKERAA